MLPRWGFANPLTPTFTDLFLSEFDALELPGGPQYEEYLKLLESSDKIFLSRVLSAEKYGEFYQK